MHCTTLTVVNISISSCCNSRYEMYRYCMVVLCVTCIAPDDGGYSSISCSTLWSIKNVSLLFFE